MFRLILDTPWMRELSVAEQRYQAVSAVISDSAPVPIAPACSATAAKLIGAPGLVEVMWGGDSFDAGVFVTLPGRR